MSILKWRGQDAQMSLRGFQRALESDDPPETGIKPRPQREAPVWRLPDALEKRAICHLCAVTFPIGSGHKRFARNLSVERITDKQSAYLWSLVWRYRRQVPSADLVEHARRLTQPNTDGAFLQ